MNNTSVFPGSEWSQAAPEDVGMNGGKLKPFRGWLAVHSGGKPYRMLVVRHGHLVAEWENRLSTDARVRLASAAKSVYSSILGIAVSEGKIPSADAKVVDYYPEMMDVPEGRGPKEGRYAFPKDREITFRQLVSNTSGYMKPGENPGKVFHYQTYGMNILTHALGAIYGVYDTENPGEEPGFGQLIDRYIKKPIGANWTYRYTNFDLHDQALLNIFGNYCQIESTARDMARLGLLWSNWGRWEGEQRIPEGWLRGASRVAPDVLENCEPSQRSYGYGFWTNDQGLLWPDLPRDSFAASGAGSQHIWVCPSLDLVVVQGPGIYETQDDDTCRRLLFAVCDAVI